MSFIRGKVPHPSSYSSATSATTRSASSDRGGLDSELLEDLVVYGDGGLFMDRVISPVFMVMAYEVRNMIQIKEKGS
jgi:hypothetical protein